jgi:hypothetical protein
MSPLLLAAAAGKWLLIVQFVSTFEAGAGPVRPALIDEQIYENAAACHTAIRTLGGRIVVVEMLPYVTAYCVRIEGG